MTGPGALPAVAGTGLVIDLVARGQADTVTSWSDSSPAGAGTAVFTTGSAPAVRVDNATPAGGPAVRFTDAGYRTGNAHAFDTAGSGEMFAVVRDGGSNSFHGFYQLGGNSPVYYNWSNYIFDGSFTYSNFPFPASGLTDWHIYNVSHDGTTRTTRIDGVVVYTAAAAFVAPSASNYPDIMIGSPGWTGDVAEFAAYTRSLSDTERTQVYDYLRAAYFTPPAPPAPAALQCPPVAVAVTAGGAQVTVPALAVAPLVVTVGTAGPVVAEPVVVAMPALPVSAVMPAPPSPGALTLTVAPVDAGIDAPAPITGAGTATPYAPIGIVVPGARPAFTVTVDNDAPGQLVHVQYTGDLTFATGTADAFTDAPTGLDAGMVTVQAGTPVGDGVIWWRARLTGANGTGPFSGPVRFAVNTLEGQAVASGDLTVTAAVVPVPHLWFIDTDATGAEPGDPAVIAGTGFGGDPRVMFGTYPCEVTEVVAVAADPGTAPADRVIDPGVVCTPAHQQITFTIPDLGADHTGDALTVQRG